MGESDLTQDYLQRVRQPVEGLLDLNLTLNFGKQWPEMKDFAYETRMMLFDTLYNVEHLGALLLGFLVGVLLTSLIVLLFTRRRSVVATVALFLATCGVYAQPPEPQVDLVTIPYVDKNFGSRIDGSGMCVFNSFRGCLVSQYRDDFDDYARWLAQNFEGGGYPSRLTEYTRAYCRAKGINDFDSQYVQVVGADTVQAMQDALDDGRSAAFTYSGDPSFYGGPVPHMCNIVYLDSRWMGVVDNNRPDRVEWVARDVGLQRHRHYDAGWAVVYLGKPQLSRPVNRPPIDPPDRQRDWYGFSAGIITRSISQCATCGPSPSLGSPSLYSVPQSDAGAGYTWQRQSNGVWYLYRGNVRQGEYHETDGRYYTYVYNGGLQESVNPFAAPTGRGQAGSGSKITGVLYGGFPELRRGQTLYGYGTTPIADTVNQRLYQDKVKRDRTRARIVVNGSSELEDRIRRLLKSLNSDAFVYGREAWEVIKMLGYGQGVTVTAGTKNGVSVDFGFWQQEPSESQLREALIKADPSYRPGGGVTESIDFGVGILALVLVALVSVYAYLNFRHKGN